MDITEFKEIDGVIWTNESVDLNKLHYYKYTVPAMIPTYLDNNKSDKSSITSIALLIGLVALSRILDELKAEYTE